MSFSLFDRYHRFARPGNKISGLCLICLLPLTVLATAFLAVPSASGAEKRSIELILDASGSMNGRLADGTVKLEAAKAAVSKLVEALDPAIRLSYRAYGHQSPRAAHDCGDTALLAGFDAAGSIRADVLRNTEKLKAQGYTPITYVIGLAADDLKAEDVAERIVVLISDGKETCEGDPCATARKLKEADAKLVIHTVGFGVDDATRFQLKCIADATGGSYFAPESADELADSLKAAAAAAPEEATIKIARKPGPGRLEIKGAGLRSHDVFEAESGEKVASISKFKTFAELPAGIYNVTFSEGVWKSVVVKAGETTVLEPGVLVIENPDFSHKILDSETGEVVASVNSSLPRAVLIPSTFDVTFHEAVWPDVVVGAGETKILRAGVIKVTGANATVHDTEGKKLVGLSSIRSRASFPPGDYVVRVEGQEVPVTLTEGKIVNLKIE